MTIETLLILILCGTTFGLSARCGYLSRRLKYAERDVAWFRQRVVDADWTARYYSERLDEEVNRSYDLAGQVMELNAGESHDN